MNQLIDSSVLNTLEASVGKEGLPLVLEIFVRQGQEDLQRMKADISPTELKTLCHTLQGSAASVGAIRLSEQAKQVNNDLMACPDEIPDLAFLSALLKSSLIALNTHLLN